MAPLCYAAVRYLRSKWPVWFAAFIDQVYKDTDTNDDGVVSYEECYTGILRLYLTVNEYGIRCYSPDRSTVMQKIQAIDSDASGTLSKHEFIAVMKTFQEDILARATTLLLFAFLCPIIASAICQQLCYLVPEGLSTSLVEYLPAAVLSLPATILSTVLMLLRPVVTRAFDKKQVKKLKESKSK